VSTLPKTNQRLWTALSGIYARQRDAAEAALTELNGLAESDGDLAHDPLARDALNAAIDRQQGQLRYAESQLALVSVMQGYWEQRVADPRADRRSDLLNENMVPKRRNPLHPKRKPTSQPASSQSDGEESRADAARLATQTNTAPTTPSRAMAANVAE